MTLRPLTPPADAAGRRGAKPVVVYPVGTLARPDITGLEAIRQTIVKQNEIIVPPRDARTFRVKRGQFFRIICMEGAQRVGLIAPKKRGPACGVKRGVGCCGASRTR